MQFQRSDKKKVSLLIWNDYGGHVETGSSIMDMHIEDN